MKHYSVLLNESILGLNIKEDGIYVDATLGLGGHSKEILKRIPKGHLYAFDEDINALNYADNILKEVASNFTLIKLCATVGAKRLLYNKKVSLFYCIKKDYYNINGTILYYNDPFFHFIIN